MTMLIRYLEGDAFPFPLLLPAILGSCDNKGGQRFSQMGDECESHRHAQIISSLNKTWSLRNLSDVQEEAYIRSQTNLLTANATRHRPDVPPAVLVIVPGEHLGSLRESGVQEIR